MGNASYRDILLTQLHKTETKQKNQKYSYNAYTEDEMNDILHPKKKLSAIVSKITFKIDKGKSENNE